MSDVSPLTERVPIQGPFKIVPANVSPAEDPLPSLLPKSSATSLSLARADLALVSNLGGGPRLRPASLFLLPQPTNGLLYLRASANTKRVDLEHHALLPLYRILLGDVGAGPWDYRTLAELIDQRTGGISAEFEVASEHDRLDKHMEALVVSTRALERNIPAMMRIAREVISRPLLNLENKARIATLINQNAATASNMLQENPLHFAMTHSASLLTPAAFANEEFGGLKMVREFMGMSIALEENEQFLPDVIKELNHVHWALFDGGIDRMLVIGDEPCLKTARPLIPNLLQLKTPDEPAAEVASLTDVRFNMQMPKQRFGKPYVRTFIGLPGQLFTNAMSLPTVPFTHPDSPALVVLGRILESNYLHPEIREKGGAYGAGAGQSSDGIFQFYSMRDPNSVETLNKFRRSTAWLHEAKLTDRDVEQALLAIFSYIDAPLAPSQKGLRRFLFDLTDDMRQQFRTRLLAVTKQDLLRVADQYLTPLKLNCAPVTVIGDEEAIPSTIEHGKDHWVIETAEGPDIDGEEAEEDE